LGERDNMQAFILLFLSEILLLRLTSATTLKVQRRNMRVRISAVGDTIVFKFFQPHVDTRLEGYILGYGSSMFSKQFIQLPEDGQPYETEIDAEPKYLIAVQSKNPEEPKKKCAGKQFKDATNEIREQLMCIQLPQKFTVRYREKEPSDTWNYQTCPSTSTVIDNLKPGALYEFAVRADTDTNSGVWSPTAIHNTAGGRKIPRPFLTIHLPPTRPFLPLMRLLFCPHQRPQAQFDLETSPVIPVQPKQILSQRSRFDTGDNSSVFSSHPLSEVDATGKKRFVAPHVVYRTNKRPEEPCSVTHSLSFFPDEEVGYLNVTGPPKTPPSNLTVVTVEGCPSFIILDWDKTDNETTEYEVVSSTKGPHGEEVSIQTTNQTHTAVENLKPESSYEFKVTPKNELGSGPASEPVTFSTESADPRVSEIQTGKNAIWSSFPFKADSYSECNGQQFIKRTWYRKFVGIQLCNSLRYMIYLSDSLNGKFYSIGDQTGYGEDHCQFVDSFLDGRTGGPLSPDQLPPRKGFYRAMRQEPVKFGEIGGNSMINYMAWYECGIPIPGKW
uniref:ABI family, member 3 (NESH) binding protein a n=1 Tax=Sinocyclocheilus grahami TaxID=75366 RepID=A0A672KSK2_SINGR